jgi:hypothetical protein
VPAKPTGGKCCEDVIPAQEMDQRLGADLIS